MKLPFVHCLMRCLFAVSSRFVLRASLTVNIDLSDVTNKYYTLLYTYKKYPLILPIFLHQNTKSRITLLAFSDSVSPSSIVYPRRTTFTLVLYLGKTRQRAGIWIKYYYDVIFPRFFLFLNVFERKTQRLSAPLTSQMTSYICDDVA